MLHINNACIAFGTEVLFSGFSMKLEREKRLALSVNPVVERLRC